MSRKKVLLAMMEVGGEHKMPALAIKEALERLYPGRYEIEVADLGAAAGAHEEDRRYKAAWDAGLAWPRVTRLLYVLMDTLRPLSRPWLKLQFPDIAKKGMAFIRDTRPDLVLSTHFFTLQISAAARRRFDLPCKVIGFDSDPWDAFTWWAERDADWLCVSSEEARELLIARGVRPERIRIVPYPIARKFLVRAQDHEAARSPYQLDPTMKTMLTTLGGQGIGDVTAYVEEIYRQGMPFNILAVCGKNQAAKERLEQLCASVPSRTRLVPLGFVNNMEELLSVSDFCVSKAGANTLLEAVARTCPIIITSFAGYNEKTNITWCLKQQVGWYTPSHRSFFRTLATIQQTDILAQYRENIRRLKLPLGADELAHFVAQELDGEQQHPQLRETA